MSLKVLFVNDSSNAANWGDRAAGRSLSHLIISSGAEISDAISEAGIFRTRFANVDTALRPEPKPADGRDLLRPFVPPIVLSARRGILDRVGARERRGLIPQGWEEYDACLRPVARREGPWGDFLDMADRADLVLIHGDGSIVGNGLHPRTLLFLAYVVKKLTTKPVALVNHTADLAHPALHRVAREVYPLLDDVVFRDTVSVDRCSAFCDGRYAPDTAFLYEPAPRHLWLPVAGRETYFDTWPDQAGFDPREPYVCLGGSSLVNPDAPVQPVIRQFAALVKELQAAYAGRVVLTLSDLVDEIVFRPIGEQLGLPVIGVATSIQQTVDILGNADAYVGGRWHPSIFALRGGTPIVPLPGKTFKMQALAEMVGLPFTAPDSMDLAGAGKRIVDQMLAALAEGESLRERIRSQAEKMARDCWDNVRCVSRLTSPESVA
jgi:hypothetical protein